MVDTFGERIKYAGRPQLLFAAVPVKWAQKKTCLNGRQIDLKFLGETPQLINHFKSPFKAQLWLPGTLAAPSAVRGPVRVESGRDRQTDWRIEISMSGGKHDLAEKQNIDRFRSRPRGLDMSAFRTEAHQRIRMRENASDFEHCLRADAGGDFEWMGLKKKHFFKTLLTSSRNNDWCAVSDVRVKIQMVQVDMV